jgi:peptidyl-prolyl cis-trans isomerase B (cyclophilin B)
MRFDRLSMSARAIALAMVAVLAIACSPEASSRQSGAAPSGAGASAPSGSGASAVPGSGSTAACPASAPAHATAGSVATVTVETPKGTIVMKLEADLGPAAVGNFLALARCGYYDGVVFHRLVPGFVIQGGDGEFGKSAQLDTTRVGSGGPGYTIDDDPVTATYGRGVVAMARTPQPHSQGSQFFIVLADGARPALEAANTYAIMGHVISGMEVADAIAAMPNSGEPNNAAIDPVPMTRITVSTP